MLRQSLSLTAKLVLIAAALVAIVHGGTLAYFIYRGAVTGADAGPQVSFPDQAAAVAELLAQTAPGEEALLLRALNAPSLILAPLNEDGAPQPAARGPVARLMQHMVDRALDDRLDGAERPEVAFAFVDREAGGNERTIAPLLPVDAQVMQLVIALPDGRRFLMAADSPFLSLGMTSRAFGNNLLILLLVIAVLLFLIRRIVAPLTRFTTAAQTLADDIDAAPLDETQGVREVRDAARAFNAMQGEIKRLIADRTLMLASISHDMRTLVTRWGLRAEALGDADMRARSLADVAELRQMLSQFLDYAQASDGALALRRVDLASLVQSVCDEFREDRVEVECAIKAKAVVETDPTALKRIIRNLVSNAVRYGERADLTLTEDAGGPLLSICDQGPGLSADELAALSRPFARGEGSRNRDAGGMGLGLGIVMTLAKRIGVALSFQTPAAGGLCVRLRL